MTNSAACSTVTAGDIAQLYRDDAFRMLMTSCPQEVITLAQVFHADYWNKSFAGHPAIESAKAHRTLAAFSKLQSLWLACKSAEQRQRVIDCCETLNSALATKHASFWN